MERAEVSPRRETHTQNDSVTNCLLCFLPRYKKNYYKISETQVSLRLGAVAGE